MSLESVGIKALETDLQKFEFWLCDILHFSKSTGFVFKSHFFLLFVFILEISSVEMSFGDEP